MAKFICSALLALAALARASPSARRSSCLATPAKLSAT